MLRLSQQRFRRCSAFEGFLKQVSPVLRTSVVTTGAPGASVSTTSGAMSCRVTVITGAAGTTAVVTSSVVAPSRLMTTGAMGVHTTSDSGEPGRMLVVTMGAPGS